ncbi:alpha/beta hydrolase [Dokdonella sp.]|uniref:alpha/beta hydrolase n=1 Tax=Dokdonella sp. TaxID=2291710 RepID=UPI001B1D37D2|nr:alpha/beta hydrolase [Dokdonella sp.]MBO9663883.1 alpha/beta hydrolase [Dokdonella sp.]
MHVPLLLIAGERDRHATLEQSQALYEAANEPKQFWGVTGAAHGDLHAYAKAEYERRLLAFLASSLRKADVQATARSIPSAATSTMKLISSGVMQYGGMK